MKKKKKETIRHPPLCLRHRRRHHPVSDQPTTTTTIGLPPFSSFSHRHVEPHSPFDLFAVPTNQEHDGLWPTAKIADVNRRNPAADTWTANDGVATAAAPQTGEDSVAISSVVALLFRRCHSPSCYVATAASVDDYFSDDTAITAFSHH
ncbi:unnamed protein product [Lactuca virosa]|uniref:Uncharacterized protein n=1 Tax=Lactuca virosa TaxID=75947 RepID=A0AAU9MVU9_9ASTR|nr:unnamed protein product [Lactuca virosa]